MSQIPKWVWVAGGSAVLLYALALILVPLISPKPDNLGLREGKLTPCPESPNCVISQDGDAAHQMAAIPFTGTAAQVREQLLGVIHAMPRTRVLVAEATYIHAEFRTAVFRFIDDVEFYIDEAAGVVHFRSAARLGYSDMDVNRQRMEEISQAMRP